MSTRAHLVISLIANQRYRVGRLIFSAHPILKLQRIAQWALRGPRLTTIVLGCSVPFRCWTSEKYYWLGDYYESDLRRIIEATLSIDSVFYDVGAHAGFWPVVLSRRCSRIFAFEPSPENFTRLCQNVRPLANVTPVNIAASGVPGVLRFSENGSMSTVTESGGVEVRAIRLDDFVADGNPPPAIVKIDIEGHGAQCLAGMQQIIERHRPVLFMEVHNAEEERAATALPGYTTEALDTVGRFPYRIRAVPDKVKPRVE